MPGQTAATCWIQASCWLAGGVLLGAIAGEISEIWVNPTTGRPEAAEILVAAGDEPGRETALSSTHAEIVIRNISLFPESEQIRINASDLIHSTRIQSNEIGTRIEVRLSERPDESRTAVHEIARLFRSIPEEAALCAQPVPVPAFTDQDRQFALDAKILKELLQDQASRAGFVDFSLVVPRAIRGSSEAKKLAQDENFSRRLRRYEEISMQLGLEGAPGQPPTPAPPVIHGPRFVEPAPTKTRGFVARNGVSLIVVVVGAAGALSTIMRCPNSDPVPPLPSA